MSSALHIMLLLGSVVHATKSTGFAELQWQNADAIVFDSTATSTVVHRDIDLCCLCIQGVFE
jgi:hypothetical protein